MAEEGKTQEKVQGGMGKVKQDLGAGEDNPIKVTTGGLRPPRLYKHSVERKEVVMF